MNICLKQLKIFEYIIHILKINITFSLLYFVLKLILLVYYTKVEILKDYIVKRKSVTRYIFNQYR